MFGCACVCLVRAFANNTATTAGISGHTSECKLLDICVSLCMCIRVNFEYAGLYSVNVWILLNRQVEGLMFEHVLIVTKGQDSESWHKITLTSTLKTLQNCFWCT